MTVDNTSQPETTMKTLTLTGLTAFALVLVAANAAMLLTPTWMTVPLVCWNIVLAFKVGKKMAKLVVA